MLLLLHNGHKKAVKKKKKNAKSFSKPSHLKNKCLTSVPDQKHLLIKDKLYNAGISKNQQSRQQEWFEIWSEFSSSLDCPVLIDPLYANVDKFEKFVTWLYEHNLCNGDTADRGIGALIVALEKR